MAQGLQIFDSSGNVIFDSTVQTTYVLGSGNTGTSRSGSLYDERLIGYDNQFWVQMTSAPTVPEFQGFMTPKFSLSNGTLSWYHDTVSEAWGLLSRIYNRTFIYGVY